MTYSNDLKKKILKCILSKKYTDTQIMNIFEISRKTFYKFKKLSKLKGYDKNNILRNSRRKSKITNPIKTYIKKYVLCKIIFNYKKLIANIKMKYNMLISKSIIYKILSDAKIKKKKIYKKTNPNRKKKRESQIRFFKEQVNDALKNSSMNNIISLDETSIDSHIDYDYGWSRWGKKITITKTHPRIRYTLTSAVSCNKMIHYDIIKGSSNGENFLKFMKALIKKFSADDTYYIIMNNARIHYYKKFKKYISKKTNIKIIYNIPYSPETNPIEQIFNDIKNYLKNIIINNNNIVDEIKNSFITIKKNNLKSYFNKSLNYY